MTLKEAIEIVKSSLDYTIPTIVSLEYMEQKKNALELLIETGKAFVKGRQENNPSFLALLPGETEKTEE